VRVIRLCIPAALLTMLFTSAVHAEDDPNAKAVKYRQSVLTVMGGNFGPLVAMARGNIPYDADAVALRGKRLHQMTLMMEEAFTRDTSAADVDTAALDKIWSNWDDFTSKIADVQAATLALSEDGTGGMDAFKTAFSNVGSACKGCHDNYKED
jgi:cytochrome c556